MFAAAFLVLFLVQLPAISHFAGATYSHGQLGVDPRVRGTAVCNNTVLLPVAVLHSSGNATVNAAISFAMANGSAVARDALEALGLARDAVHGTTIAPHNACYLGQAQLVSGVAGCVVLVIAFGLFRMWCAKVSSLARETYY
jgi:hypothetical protein